MREKIKPEEASALDLIILEFTESGEIVRRTRQTEGFEASGDFWGMVGIGEEFSICRAESVTGKTVRISEGSYVPFTGMYAKDNIRGKSDEFDGLFNVHGSLSKTGNRP